MFFRYSIAYFNSSYDKTIRAEIVTKEEQLHEPIRRKLILFVDSKIQKANKGVKRIMANSEFIGFEADEVGDNDVVFIKPDKFYFDIS